MLGFHDKIPKDIRDCKYKSLDDLAHVSISMFSELNRPFLNVSLKAMFPNPDLPINIPS